MSNDIKVNDSNTAMSTLEDVVIRGDLKKLSPQERVEYVKKLCESVGLNPLTQPFEYMELQGKLVLYAKKGATDQLRSIHSISIDKVETQQSDDMLIVTAYASRPGDRHDCDVGAISLKGLGGANLANAIMKAHTKAKRRVTMSICGLGLLNESEVEDIRTIEVENDPLISSAEAECLALFLENLEESAHADLLRWANIKEIASLPKSKLQLTWKALEARNETSVQPEGKQNDNN